MAAGDELLNQALEDAAAGGAVLVVAPEHERAEALMRNLTELALARGSDVAALDDRTISVGAGVCAFFPSETVEFVLERKHWYGARGGVKPALLWDGDSRERAARVARLFPDKSADRSHVLFGGAHESRPAGAVESMSVPARGTAAEPVLPNPFLTRLMRKLREGRLRLTRDLAWYNNVHEYPDGLHVSTWFQTQGCSWDLRAGGCTMCNFARGLDLTSAEMLANVRRAVAETEPLRPRSRFVYSAGSTLDPAEVPPETRIGIWEILRGTCADKVKTQARPEHVTSELAQEFASAFPGRERSLHLGLESSCAWVQRFCINRGGHPDDFARAASILRGRNVRVRANVSLGPAFLTQREAVDDAARSTRWAFDRGADEVGLLPVHVKPNTLLADLYSRGLHRPVSLWALVEVLSGVPRELWGGIRFHGWVSSYPDRRKIVGSPSTCPLCRERVVSLLAECHHTWSREPLEELVALECRCKDRWRREMALKPAQPLTERVIELYRLLAEEHGLSAWWRENGEALETLVRASRPEVGRRGEAPRTPRPSAGEQDRAAGSGERRTA